VTLAIGDMGDVSDMDALIAATGFIANTDFGWFSHFLHRAEPPEEVNFWQPSPHGFKAIPPGAPFFFRLGAPHRAIAGYGFFARYERVPVWLAWTPSAT
jgi:putative restriction endonuclease